MNNNIDQLHIAQIEPPEPRSCPPGEHSPKWSTLKVSDEDHGIVMLDCEKCEAVAYATVDESNITDWEL